MPMCAGVVPGTVAKPCQCEAKAHFDKEARTPFGNPSHRYGVKHYVLQSVKTPYGTFEVCPDCAADCHSQES